MFYEKKIDGHIEISFTSNLNDLSFKESIVSIISSARVRPHELPWYNKHNTILHHDPENLPADLCDIANSIGHEFFNNKFGWTINKLSPGNTVLEHTDMFDGLREKYPEFKKFIRYILMLEDRTPGQYIEVNNQPIINWKIGDYIIIRGTDIINGIDHDWHMATNGGTKPLYIMAISGPKLS